MSFDLVLNERAELIDPIEPASHALLCGEDVRGAGGVARERGELECAETVGVVIDGAAAELGQLNAGTDVVFSVAPGNDFVDVNGVLGARHVGLRSAADERAADLDGLRFGDAGGDVFIFLEGDLKLIDEVGSDDDAVVEDGVVFAGVQVVSGFRQGDTAYSRIGAAAVFEVVTDREPVIRGEVVGQANGELGVAVWGEHVFVDGAAGPDCVDDGGGVLLAIRG